MARINLRDFYPFYNNDLFVDVSDEVAAALVEAERREAAYRLRTYRHKAYYSLDREDGIEHDALFVALSPCEIYERKITAQELRAALDALPEMQGRRVYAHFILGLSKAAIARAEGVSKVTVGQSIERGLRSMEKFLKKSFG
ncbi:MAG: sigma-70 family RNA polymerase sigma factor [Enterocloster asparagiformis]|nr:sigma-70 family RNA polymerase sigma factor [Enterocloster asparagiformis]